MDSLPMNAQRVLVLLRCLAYGETATSQNEEDSGFTEKFQNEVQQIRKAVCGYLTKEELPKYYLGEKTGGVKRTH